MVVELCDLLRASPKGQQRSAVRSLAAGHPGKPEVGREVRDSLFRPPSQPLSKRFVPRSSPARTYQVANHPLAIAVE